MLSDAGGVGVASAVTCSEAGMRTAGRRGAVGGAGARGCTLTSAPPRLGAAGRRGGAGSCLLQRLPGVSNMEEAPAAGVTCERD